MDSRQILTRGAHTAGPTANPKIKRLIPTEKTWVLILKSLIISSLESEYAEDVNVTANTEEVTMKAINHFLEAGQFIGFSGSSLLNSTMKGSVLVPCPL